MGRNCITKGASMPEYPPAFFELSKEETLALHDAYPCPDSDPTDPETNWWLLWAWHDAKRFITTTRRNPPYKSFYRFLLNTCRRKYPEYMKRWGWTGEAYWRDKFIPCPFEKKEEVPRVEMTDREIEMHTISEMRQDGIEDSPAARESYRQKVKDRVG